MNGRMTGDLWWWWGVGGNLVSYCNALRFVHEVSKMGYRKAEDTALGAPTARICCMHTGSPRYSLETRLDSILTGSISEVCFTPQD